MARFVTACVLLVLVLFAHGARASEREIVLVSTASPPATAEESASLTTPPPTATPSKQLPSPVPPLARDRLRLRLGLGWLVVVDGKTNAGLQGPAVRGELRWKNVGIGLQGAVSLTGTIDDTTATLHVMRGSFGGDLLAAFPLHPAWTLEGHLGAGIVAFHRATVENPAAGVLAAPDQTDWTAELSADAVVTFAPSQRLASLRLVASLGAGLLFARPRYDFVTNQGIVEGPALWPVQPRLMLGLGWQF